MNIYNMLAHNRKILPYKSIYFAKFRKIKCSAKIEKKRLFIFFVLKSLNITFLDKELNLKVKTFSLMPFLKTGKERRHLCNLM